MRLRSVIAAAVCALLLASCGEESPKGPYVAFAGGGFIFNYNIAEAYYGFVVKVLRKIPPGTILEAEFEDPNGGEPFIVTDTAREGQIEYTFRSPGVEGVTTGREYRVELRLRPADGDQPIASYVKMFHSTADQAMMPKVPTTVGPGYQLNPESELLNPPPGKAGSSN